MEMNRCTMLALLASMDSTPQGIAPRNGTRERRTLDKLKAICKRAGIAPKTVHALRHSFGAHLRMAGVGLADIADLLGHADFATTQIYAKVH
jgi:site-specific recombinase XerD